MGDGMSEHDVVRLIFTQQEAVLLWVMVNEAVEQLSPQAPELDQDQRVFLLAMQHMLTVLPKPESL